MTPAASSQDLIIRDLCLGEPSAMEFCRVFLKWCHWIDDVIDQDKTYTPNEVVALNLEAALVFSDNPFFQANKLALMPLILQAARALGDSVTWAKRKSRRDRRASDVLKSYYHEVFWHVAFLVAEQTGRNGWHHLSEMTRQYRVFNYDCKA